jgi:hypothetical protein
MLGHESLDTTRRYLEATANELRGALLALGQEGPCTAVAPLPLPSAAIEGPDTGGIRQPAPRP